MRFLSRLGKGFVADHLVGHIKPGLKTTFSGQLCGNDENDEIDNEELLLVI
jgi:hypothetical protein